MLLSAQELGPKECLYAVGQGALAIECRESDSNTIQYLSELTDEPTVLQCIAERAFLRRLEGGCSAPVGVNSVLRNNAMVRHSLILLIILNIYLFFKD